MIINMGSGGENLKKEITEQNELIESIRKLYVELKWTKYTPSERPTRIYDAVEFNGELYGVSYSTLFKFNGESWVEIHSLDGVGDGASLVVLDGEIHLLGGMESEYQHAKWTGTGWVHVSTLPTNAMRCKAVVQGGQIHLFTQELTSYIVQKHYVWNGTSWTEEVPFDKKSSFDVVVFNDELYVIADKMYLYRNGQEWDEFLTAPAWCQKACVYDGELFIVTVDGIYMMMDEQWVNLGESPMTVDGSLQMVEVGVELVLIGNTGHFGGVFDGL